MLRIEAVTQTPRNQAIAAISRIIPEAGGSVLDHRFFSNLAMFVHAELEASRLTDVRRELSAEGLKFADKSNAVLQAAASDLAHGTVSIHLVVTFIHNDPDMRIPVLAVPG